MALTEVTITKLLQHQHQRQHLSHLRQRLRQRLRRRLRQHLRQHLNASAPTPAPTPAPNITDVTHSDDFESCDANSLSTDWNWAAYINQFDGSGNYTGGYAVVPAPIAGPQIDDKYHRFWYDLNVYSSYDVGTHNGGIVETSVFRELGADQGYLTSNMVDTYRMSFKATTNDCGGTNSDNGTTGGVCRKLCESYQLRRLSPDSVDSIETQGSSNDAINLDFEITEAMLDIFQSGFMSTAINYATSMFYDDVVVAAYTEPIRLHLHHQAIIAQDDFESYTDDDETLSWSFYVNVFMVEMQMVQNGAYEYGYGGAAPNASHV